MPTDFTTLSSETTTALDTGSSRAVTTSKINTLATIGGDSRPSLIMSPQQAGVENLLNNLSLTPTGSATKTPDFVYVGKQATLTTFPVYGGYGSNLSITGSGTDVTLAQKSLWNGYWDEGVKVAAIGKGYTAANNTVYDYTTEDLVFELVCKLPDCSTYNHQVIFFKDSYLYVSAVNFSGNTKFSYYIGDGVHNSSILSAPLTPNSIAHMMWFLDKAGSGICYTNGAVGTPVDISAVGSITSINLFRFLAAIGISSGMTTPLYYAAMWSGIDWLGASGHLQPDLAKQRCALLTGTYPTTAAGTALPTTLPTRAYPAYGYRYDVGTSTMSHHLCSNNLPRTSRLLDGHNQIMEGLLLEPAVTNLCPYSNDFSTWFKYVLGDTLNTNTYLNPDGITYMQGIIADLTNGPHYFNRYSATLTSGLTYCFSQFVKKGNKNWTLFQVYTVADGNFGKYFNLDTLTWGNNYGTGFLNYGFINYGNGIIRIWGTKVLNSTTAVLVCCPSNPNNFNYAGDSSTVNMYFGKNQLEIGNYPSSPIDTLATALTRTADINPRTNLCPYSQALASWTQTAITSVEAATVLAPDGVSYMQGIVATAVDTNHYCSIAVTLVSGSTYCFSCWAKVGNKNWIRFYIDAGATTYSGYFNLSTLTWGTSTLPLAKDYVSYGNGLYRVYAVVVADGTAGTCYAYPAHADADPDFAGDGATVNAYFWGTMCELGTLPTGYVPTPGAVAVTVSDGSLILPAGTNIGGADKGQATYEIDFLMFAKPTASRTLLKISDWGSDLDFIKMYVDTQGYMNLSSAAAWGNPGSVQIAQNFCDGQRYRAILSYKTNYLNVRVINLDTLAEVAGVADVSVTIPIRLNTIEKGPLEYGIIS